MNKESDLIWMWFFDVTVLNALTILGIHQLRVNFPRGSIIFMNLSLEGTFLGISIALHIHFAELFLHLLGLRFWLLCPILISRSRPRLFRELNFFLSKNNSHEDWIQRVPLQDVWIQDCRDSVLETLASVFAPWCGVGGSSCHLKHPQIDLKKQRVGKDSWITLRTNLTRCWSLRSSSYYGHHLSEQQGSQSIEMLTDSWPDSTHI